MKKRYKVLLIILALLLIATAVLYRYRIAIVSQIVPALATDTIKVVVKNDTAFVSTHVYATNKSFIRLNIDSIKYKIELFDKVYLHEEKFLGIDLLAYDEDTFDFSLKIPSAELIKDLAEMRKKTKDANYSIYIALQYSTFFGRVELPINKESNFRIPTPPEIKIAEVNYTEIRLDHMLADVKVTVQNFNDLNLTIQTINYKLLIPDEGSATGSYMDTISINPRSETTVDLPVTIKWFHIAQTISDLIRNKDHYDYILTIQAAILTEGENPQPILVEITKHGRLELRKEQDHPKMEKLDNAIENFFDGKKENK